MKKTIILGIIAIAVLGGIVWYGSQNQKEMEDQKASLLEGLETGNVESKEVDKLVIGDPNAPVTIVEYSSHFCGHCVDFHKGSLSLIVDKYIKTGKAKLELKLLSPMEITQAVFCAAEVGKFWEFNQYLFEKVEEIKSVQDIENLAYDFGLEKEHFDQCFVSDKYQTKIEGWFNEANEKQLGTPTLFINDEKIEGNQPYSVFEQAIEKALSEK